MIAEKTITNEYEVTFDGNGGNVSLGKITVTYDKEYDTLPIPIRNGYSFNGWYTAANGGTKISEESIVKTTSNQKLYAQWTADFGIDKKEITIKNGEQYTITANQSNLTYKSNNSDDAIVSKSGIITAVGEGKAIKMLYRLK